MYPREVVDAKEMCKDRYVLICMSFSWLNWGGPGKGWTTREVSSNLKKLRLRFGLIPEVKWKMLERETRGSAA
jgi:hypothetical protein